MTTKTRASSSPTPTGDLDEDLAVDLPGFKTPPSPGPDPLNPAATTVTTPADSNPGGESDGEHDGPSELGQTTSKTPTGQSSRASSEPIPGLQEIIGALVGVASMLVRALRTRQRELPPAVWIADEEDQAAIAGPLARLASRHTPAGDVGEDAVDGIAVLIGTTNYVMKGMQAEATPGPVLDVESELVDT